MSNKKAAKIQLPKDALMRVSMGHAFAEYDIIRDQPTLFVKTPAIHAAMSRDRTKCFFVGRRGTGKTAITYYAEANDKRTITVLPQVVSPLNQRFGDIASFTDTRQRPFKSLVTSFKQMILLSVLKRWQDDDLLGYSDIPKVISKELRSPAAEDLDIYLLGLFEERLEALALSDERRWLKHIKIEKTLRSAMDTAWDDHRRVYCVLIDRIDESWDGTDEAVVFLMALTRFIHQPRFVLMCGGGW